MSQIFVTTVVRRCLIEKGTYTLLSVKLKSSTEKCFTFVVYPLTHVDNISKRTTIETFIIIKSSKIYWITVKNIFRIIVKHLSNHYRTSTTFNLYCTHWVVLRNLNFNFLNRDLFVFLNFSFSLNRQSSND